jgi:hypothetical protein
MANTNSKRSDEESDILGALLGQPARNLEALIAQLEHQIAERKSLNDQFISSLGTQILTLQEKVRRLAYALPTEPMFKAKRESERQILDLERLRMKETLECFQELSTLQGKLLEAQSQLQREWQKVRLLQQE